MAVGAASRGRMANLRNNVLPKHKYNKTSNNTEIREWWAVMGFRWTNRGHTVVPSYSVFVLFNSSGRTEWMSHRIWVLSIKTTIYQLHRQAFWFILIYQCSVKLIFNCNSHRNTFCITVIKLFCLNYSKHLPKGEGMAIRWAAQRQRPAIVELPVH